ncbi:MAG: DNA replication and repair protein RecF [candidate division WOR-3 bacterium]
MIIKKLSIVNFRNFSSKVFAFDRRTIITGMNGSGKTSIIEAIYYLTNFKSFRTGNDKKIVKIGEDHFIINIEGEREGEDFTVGLLYKDNKKVLSLNGNRSLKLTEGFGFFISVIFSTYDKLLSDRMAIYRRKFMDRIISTIDNEYFENVVQYHSILKRKNFVLKENGDKRLLETYSLQLSEKSDYIYERRIEFISYFEDLLNNLYEKVFEKKGLVKVRYFSSKDNGDFKNTSLFEKFKTNISLEKEKRRTIFGPHLDDIVITVEGKPISDFGSEGEKTLLGITLKIAELNLIYENIGEYPVILIDDAFSELDKVKTSKLLEIFESYPQVIITFPKKWESLKDYTLIDLDKDKA